MTVFVIASLLLAGGLWARFAIGRAAAASTVDGYYWLLAARAYREQRGLPVSLPGKYLLEDETQAYPPFFGFLLGRVSNQAVLHWVTPVLEWIELLVLAALLHALGIRQEMLLLALACYVAAPVLVVYNAQLTSRILGDLFLFCAMVLQLWASFFAVTPLIGLLCWLASAVFLGLVLATHKMTLQLHLVLLPLWWWALDAWQVPLASLAGFALYVAVVGWGFARYQIAGHWDIVRFWHRHWRDLGAHQFDLSPIYGDLHGDRSSCFHAPGWRGAVKHLRVVASYAPLNLLLPLCSLISGTWPPNWVLVWIGVTYLWALATLFIPAFRSLGGGHLYVFNAIAPGAIYVGYMPATAPVIAVLVVGAVLTLLSLAMALRIVRSRPTARSQEFDDVIAHLDQMPCTRIAVFPLQSAEAVAAQTRHAVLWGGHGYGFQKLEGFFPVITRPLTDIFADHGVQWVLWDSGYWSRGKETLFEENLIHAGMVFAFGRWMLAKITQHTNIGEIRASNAGRLDLSNPPTSRKPKVLVVITKLDTGGTERHLLQVLPHLAGKFDVSVFAIHSGGQLERDLIEAGIPVRTPPRAAAGVFARFWAMVWLGRVLLLQRRTVVHFFLPEAYLLGGLCGAALGHARMVMSRRSLNVYHEEHLIFALIEKLLHRRMRFVIGNSRAVVADLLGEGVYESRVRLIYNGVHIPQIPGMQDRQSLRTQLGIGGGELVVVVVANLRPYKGHEDLIQAMWMISRELSIPWRLLVAGRDYGIRSGLEELASSLGLAEHVLFLGEVGEVSNLWAIGDIGVLPSHQEGFSNAILEGMAAGLPMIVTDVGGNAEAVLHGKTGLIVPPHLPGALGDAVLSLAFDGEKRKDYGDAARRRAQETFSVGACVGAYEEVYATLVH